MALTPSPLRSADNPALARPCALCVAQREHEQWCQPATATLVVFGMPVCQPHAVAHVRMVILMWEGMGLSPVVLDGGLPDPGPLAERDCLVCVEVAEDYPGVTVHRAAGWQPHVAHCYGHERQYARGLRLHLVESGMLTGGADERRTYGMPA